MIFRVTETELMPNLVVGDTETLCGKLKRGNRFLKPNFELGPKLVAGVRYDRYDELICYFQVVVDRAFIENPKKFTGRVYEGLVLQRGLSPPD